MLWGLWPWILQSLELHTNTFWWFYETISSNFVMTAWQRSSHTLQCMYIYLRIYEDGCRGIIELPTLILNIEYLISNCISTTAIISSIKVILPTKYVERLSGGLIIFSEETFLCAHTNEYAEQNYYQIHAFKTHRLILWPLYMLVLF